MEKDMFAPSYPIMKMFGLQRTDGNVSDCYGAELYKG